MFETVLYTVKLSGTVILSRIGRQSGTEGTVRLVYELLDAGYGGIRSNGSGSEGVDETLQGCGGDCNHCPLHGERNTEADRLRDYHAVNLEVLTAQLEVRIRFQCVNQTTDACKQLCDDGGNSGTENAHVEDADVQKVHADIQEAGNNQEIQRCSGVSECTEHGRRVVIYTNKRNAKTADTHIERSSGKDICRCFHEFQDGRRSDKCQNAHDKRCTEHKIGGVCDGAFYLICISGAKVLGGNDARTGTDTVADGKEQKGNRAGRAYGSECRRTDEFSDDDGIGKVVRLLEQIADQHRDGKQDEQAGRIAGCHVKGFIVFHLSSKDCGGCFVRSSPQYVLLIM